MTNLNNVSESKERVFVPTLAIRPQTPRDEVDYFLELIPYLGKENAKDYSWELPTHPVFQAFLQKPTSSEVDKERLVEVMKEIYDPKFFLPGIAALENVRPVIESVFPTFIELNSAWGFEVFPNYTISLTRYGPGAFYHLSAREIVMLTFADGSFKRKQPTHTPVHEMVHMGIEDQLVQKFGLYHGEKERLVDLMCLHLFSDKLPDYHLQTFGDPKIDEFISPDIIRKNLPEVIEKYVAKYPRKTAKTPAP